VAGATKIPADYVEAVLNLTAESVGWCEVITARNGDTAQESFANDTLNTV